jgi:PTH2 family peptidyl-tRNA hydrolase
MRKGKMCAQAAHASMKVILDMMDTTYFTLNNDAVEIEKSLRFLKHTFLDEWVNGSFKKVVVYVNSEEELALLYTKAIARGIRAAYIIDNGLTEFHGEKTLTCIAIGPHWSDEIDKITGELPLL